MDPIASNLTRLQQQIIAAEQRYGRKPHSVQLLAVSKTQPIAAIQEACAAGQKAFGENYLQEALPKIAALHQENIEWHFIGALQANKTKAIAENFRWVHSVDRLSIAERLNQQRPSHLPPLNICLQVNIDSESNKAGVDTKTLPELAASMNRLQNLKLRGLMAIPAPREIFVEQCKVFHKLNLLLQELQVLGLPMDTLSMGMSDDFEAAIAEGSTLVRIGTKIFGKRAT